MVGVCTECGLELGWSEVLNPVLAPRWLPEHHPRSVIAPFRMVLTALRPQRLMRTMPLTLRLRPLSALVLPVTLLCALYAIGIGAALLKIPLPDHPRAYAYWGGALPDPTIVQALLWPFDYNLLAGSGYTLRRIASVLGLVVLVHALAMPLSFLTLRITLRRVNIMFGHFVRLGAISISTICMIAIATLVLRLTLDALECTSVLRLPLVLEPFVEWNLHSSWYAGTNTLSWPACAMYAYAAWSLLFWWSACRWYLRLPSAALHASVLYLVAAVFTTFILFFTSDTFRRFLLDLTGV